MAARIHRFEHAGRRYALDPETCFCFECDAISWEILEFYPHTPTNRIHHLLGERHPHKEIDEVIGELEWLRASKSILTPPKAEELPKLYQQETGINHVVVVLGAGDAPQSEPSRGWFGRRPSPGAAAGEALANLRAALTLLFARSEAQKSLRLEIVFSCPPGAVDSAALEAFFSEAFNAARLAGKSLAILLHVPNLPSDIAAFHGHRAGVRVELGEHAQAATVWKALGRLDAAAKLAAANPDGITIRATLHPGHAAIVDAVRALDEAGFSIVEIDLDGAFTADAALDPAAMASGLHDAAVYYANRLLGGRYFRLDPIAPLFWRIYNGTPIRRADPAGVNTLAVGPDGAIYPSRAFVGDDAFRAGKVGTGGVAEAVLAPFQDAGAMTTPACIRCWARFLCGGGAAAVHHARTGSIRTPDPVWCDAQRAAISMTIVAFNLLSARGVNFAQVYQTLNRPAKPSLFAMARAALSVRLAIRPIEEGDAELLARWENWSTAAYFTFTESGLLLATHYDREMDSLHPRGYEQEFMILRKDGAPMGLLRLRPDRTPGAAWAWVYFRDPGDYAAESVRRSFRSLLGEAGAHQALERLLVPVGPDEGALATMLESLGFSHSGTLREALYLHGAYHDIRILTAALG